MPKLGSTVLILLLFVLALFAYWAYSASLQSRSRTDYWPKASVNPSSVLEISNKPTSPEPVYTPPLVSISPTITSVAVQNPLFVVFGKNLARVQIWAVLSNAGEDTGTNILIGNALRQSAAGYDERWILAIPPGPLSVSSFFAKGFDSRGLEVSTVPFPIAQTAHLFSQQ